MLVAYAIKKQQKLKRLATNMIPHIITPTHYFLEQWCVAQPSQFFSAYNKILHKSVQGPFSKMIYSAVRNSG
jgi:hypothetical protein